MGILDGLTGKLEGVIDDMKKSLKEREHQQWEYHLVDGRAIGNIDHVGGGSDSVLTVIGEHRWELVAVTPNNVWVFKWPKLTEANDGKV